MGHYINGFIASYKPLVAAAKAFPGAFVCRLQSGFGFLPLTQDVASLDDPAAEYQCLNRLTSPMAAWAIEQSTTFPIAYIQTDYFGGVGSQCAILWRDGAVAFGPIESINEHGETDPHPEGAINSAVRLLGVERSHGRDEFETLGLHLHRDNEDWLGAATLTSREKQLQAADPLNTPNQQGHNRVSLWRYRLVCPHCGRRAIRSEVLGAQMNHKGSKPAFACVQCGASVAPDFRLKWLRKLLAVLGMLAVVVGIFIRPEWLILWTAALFAWLFLMTWSFPYITPLKTTDD